MADPPELNEGNDQDDEDETTETNEDDHRLISDAEENDDEPSNVPDSCDRDGDEVNHGNDTESEQVDHETGNCRSDQQDTYHQVFHGPQHHSHLMVHGYPYPHSTPPQSYQPYDQHHYVHHANSAPFYPPLPSYGIPAPHPPHQHYYHPNPHPMMPVFAVEGNNVQTTSSFVNNSGTMNNAAAMAHVYHEQAARMRDHAAAYANAAAGAAWAAAQIANAAAEFASSAAASSTLSPVGGFLPHHSPPLMFPPLQTAGNAACTLNRYETSEEPCASAIPNLYYRKQENSSAEVRNSNPDREESFPESDAANYHEGYQRGRRGSEEKIPANGNAQPKRRTDSKRNQRKRIQRLFPDDSQGALGEPNPAFLSQSQQRGKIRRRLRSDCDSSTTSSGSSFMPQNGLSRSRSGNHHNKKKARSDESLRGKTAVAALFEWCSKRQITPNFVLEQQTPDDFDYLVYLDGCDEVESKVATSPKENSEDKGGKLGLYIAEKVWGRGRGRNKVVAKQEAARRTLQMLIPGVVFDDNTGILVDLPPPTAGSNSMKNSLDELAPNLAKQLAIGQRTASTQITKQSHQSKRTLDIYPGTSTTSEDEDENTYYTSRGASVCSVLLHAMVQIDTERILEAPSFTYHVVPPAQLLAGSGQLSNDELRLNGSSRNPLPAVRSARGSFTCTARLKIREKERILRSTGIRGDHICEKESPTIKASKIMEQEPVEISVPENSRKEQSLDDSQTQESELVDKFSTLGKDSDQTIDAQPNTSIESVLEATGTGGSKREARHIASAKLLALLFPDCKDMVEVKAAAEAMREKYAASKMSKMQHQNMKSSHRQKESSPDDLHLNDRKHDSITTLNTSSSCFAVANPSDPSVPRKICDRIQSLFEQRPLFNQNKRLNDTSVDSQSEFPEVTEYKLRYLNRLKQLDYRVECALQILNDRDEEGRALPDELTADDVGRLVLRRAEQEDSSRIKRLQFFTPDKLHRETDDSDSQKMEFAKLDHIASILATEHCSCARQEVGNSFIILLLCRAIAAFEDPPLGCAILSLGFSIERGCLLLLVGIAREKHLPMERFVDCLKNFAGCMKCDFEIGPQANKNFVELTSEDTTYAIKSYLCEASDYNLTAKPNLRTSNRNGKCFIASTTKLQSVKEESEVSDSSTNEKRAGKRASKPSKRSRFE